MNFRPCPRQAEVDAALKAGHWPHATDSDLQRHVNSCERCTELTTVSLAFKAARADSMLQAPAVAPGLLWWRAQLRRRNEALERMSKPTYFAGGFALASALLVALGFLVWQRQEAAGWVDWVRTLSHSHGLRLETLWNSAANWNLALLVACLGSIFLLGVVAVYVASSKE